MDPNYILKFSIHQDTLQYKGKLVLSRNSTLIPALHLDHYSVIGGHSGLLCTYKRVQGKLYWEGMKRNVETNMEHCTMCEKNRTQVVSQAGLLRLHVPKCV